MEFTSSYYPTSPLNYLLAMTMKKFEQESETWKQLLDFMMQETIGLKKRLSDAVNIHTDKNTIKEMDNFETSFVRQDQLIGLLRNEINQLDKLLLNELSGNSAVKKDIDKRLMKLRYNMTTCEKQFEQLKLRFIAFSLKIYNQYAMLI